MAGYRDTLNLPKTDFPMRADLTTREPQRLEWWEEQRVWARLREQRRGRPLWLLHDGPPYSNAHLHMGTAANKIWKDAVVRQASLQGFDAPYLPGWDNHGMPIEIRVSSEFRERGETPERLTLRRRCREYAAHWVGIQRREFERLGVWGDWQDPYLTMASGFEAGILEQLATLAERGFIQRGLRSIHWCPTDRTALAEAEIEYEDDPSPSIFVTFPLRHDPRGALAGLEGVEAVAWTTTPWTLPGNLGLMVDPAAPYVVVAEGGRRFLLAAPRLAAVREAAGWTRATVEREMRGEALVDAVFEGPWGNDSRVVDGTPYVSMEDGTGLVHTAPGHGKEDFIVGQRSGLGVICPVDEAGRFTAGTAPFEGRSVLEVNDDILGWLRERGRLLAASSFIHSYPHCWRCRKPVIFRATDQWFMIIDHAPVPLAGPADAPPTHRERALEQIERAVRWDPPASQNRIRESVKGRPDWCLSRQRSWGVGIPALYCESCGQAALVPAVARRVAERVREQDSDVWYERPVGEFLPAGFTCPACGSSGPFRKETDILDVWFDSGSTHRAVQATHPAFRDAWHRARAEGGRIVYFEGPDQHRGWFNSSLMVSVGVADEAPYTDVLTHGWVLDAQGRAMHKSVGNVILPADLVKHYGADVLRWWALATDWRTDVRVGDYGLRMKELDQLKVPKQDPRRERRQGDEILERCADAYRKVRNTFRFLLGNLFDFEPSRALSEERLTRVDRAFAGLLGARLHELREEYARLEFHRALDTLLNLCTVDLSAVYLDAAKDRLYTLAPDDPRRRSAQTVLWQALHDLAIAASPALVFTAEEAWQHHAGLRAECDSVHLAQWPERAAGDTGDWDLLVRVRDGVNAAIEPLRAAKAMTTTEEAEVTLTARPALAARLERFEDELARFLLVARIDVRPAAGGALADEAEFAVEVARTAATRCERCWTYRRDVAGDGADAGLCARCVEALAAGARGVALESRQPGPPEGRA